MRQLEVLVALALGLLQRLQVLFDDSRGGLRTLARARVSARNILSFASGTNPSRLPGFASGDGAEPGVVLDVVQKGYRLDGQLIRAARVVVSE